MDTLTLLSVGLLLPIVLGTILFGFRSQPTGRAASSCAVSGVPRLAWGIVAANGVGAYLYWRGAQRIRAVAATAGA